MITTPHPERQDSAWPVPLPPLSQWTDLLERTNLSLGNLTTDNASVVVWTYVSSETDSTMIGVEVFVDHIETLYASVWTRFPLPRILCFHTSDEVFVVSPQAYALGDMFGDAYLLDPSEWDVAHNSIRNMMQGEAVVSISPGNNWAAIPLL